MIRVGVDWGSSSFRAYRFNELGLLVDELSANKGIREIQPQTPEQYESVLFDLIGHWLTDGDCVLLSGMITSRTGWVETPYLPCPVDVSTLAKQAHCLNVRNTQLRFLPGLKQISPAPDVMRGEELQLLGATKTHVPQSDELPTTATPSIVVLPGTHSKWAVMNGSVLSQFRTVITGELFDILIRHSLIGTFFTSTCFDRDSFLEGVKTAYSCTTFISDLFTLRSSVLLEQADTDAQHSRLSGMLIGNEIREGVAMMGTNGYVDSVVLVGSDTLCSHYQDAFHSLGVSASVYSEVASVSGFQKIAATFSESGNM